MISFEKKFSFCFFFCGNNSNSEIYIILIYFILFFSLLILRRKNLYNKLNFMYKCQEKKTNKQTQFIRIKIKWHHDSCPWICFLPKLSSLVNDICLSNYFFSSLYSLNFFLMPIVMRLLNLLSII